MKRYHRIIWHQTIDSTNSEAVRRISDIDNLSVIAAVRQTAGRGQRGNVWTADAGENLTFSLVLKPGCDDMPPVAASGQFLISELAALSVSGYLESKGLSAGIKWPNDIYIEDRKICGILIENCVRDSRLVWSIAGIGINLNQTAFPPEIPNPTSVRAETGIVCDIRKEMDRYLTSLDTVLDILSRPDGTERLRTEYLSRMYRKDERHLFRDCRTAGTFHATIRGISEDGRLLAETDDGSVREFAFKEIGYLINDREL